MSERRKNLTIGSLMTVVGLVAGALGKDVAMPATNAARVEAVEARLERHETKLDALAGVPMQLAGLERQIEALGGRLEHRLEILDERSR